MKRFAELFEALDTTTATNLKVAAKNFIAT